MCGHLTGTHALETVAVLGLPQFHENEDGIAVSKLIILRKRRSEWNIELTADRENWIRNGLGYIGVDFIDDSADFVGYRISFSGERSRRTPRFTVTFFYLSPKGHTEGVSLGVTWNPAVGRFQEYATNEDPTGFKPEVKNPPHIRSRKTAL